MITLNISEQGIKNLAKALSGFQEEVRNPANTAVNPQFRSKYAPLDVVINTAKPVLAKYGLSFIQSTGSEGEMISVTTLLIHESGEWIETDPLTLPAYQIKGGGVKEFNAQGAGSSLTYARRYSLSAALGLSSEDDDDANGQVFGGTASAPEKKPSSNPNARDVAKQKAAEKSNVEVKNASGETVVKADNEGVTVKGTVTNVITEPINDSQIEAIKKMLKLTQMKKKDFNPDDFVAKTVTSFGAGKLEEISFEQAKEVVALLNTEMRSK